ncbi:DUF3768 domain-containing protein, partial [Paracoccaceae bacterium]|nr:DUF3768 domain-containing protein [Paracoccaceae bacterium]
MNLKNFIRLKMGFTLHWPYHYFSQLLAWANLQTMVGSRHYLAFGEHDFGAIEYEGNTVFWKID